MTQTAQKPDCKEHPFKHYMYVHDWNKGIIIADGYRFRNRGFYTLKYGKRIRTSYCPELKKKKDAPYHFKERIRMKAKMENPESRKIYNIRKRRVYPVFGHLKQNMESREFFLRGLEKVKMKMNLPYIAHNLQKIWRLKAANGF